MLKAVENKKDIQNCVAGSIAFDMCSSINSTYALYVRVIKILVNQQPYAD